MDLKAAILKEHSKPQALLIRDYIGDNQALFDVLMTHFFSNEYRVTQRAAWIMTHCVDKYPFLINPHLEKLVQNLQAEKIHDAVKRNTLRLLAAVDLTEELMGHLVDIGFKFLLDPKEPATIRIFSMQVLYNICLKEPELADELRIVIEEIMPQGTAGFRSRGKKILKG
ncbi:MAG: hypothetical protein AAGJ18_18700, partial [Bacteroidota bacterium]